MAALADNNRMGVPENTFSNSVYGRDKAHILVVDDDPTILDLFRRAMNIAGHQCSVAHDAAHALEILSHTPAEVLITDINMPGMDGFALMDEMRADDKYKDLPIIVLTASGHKKVPAIAAQKGATSFLTQPISSWELKETVTRCLQGTMVGLSS